MTRNGPSRTLGPRRAQPPPDGSSYQSGVRAQRGALVPLRPWILSQIFRFRLCRVRPSSGLCRVGSASGSAGLIIFARHNRSLGRPAADRPPGTAEPLGRPISGQLTALLGDSQPQRPIFLALAERAVLPMALTSGGYPATILRNSPKNSVGALRLGSHSQVHRSAAIR